MLLGNQESLSVRTIDGKNTPNYTYKYLQQRPSYLQGS